MAYTVKIKCVTCANKKDRTICKSCHKIKNFGNWKVAPETQLACDELNNTKLSNTYLNKNRMLTLIALIGGFYGDK